MRRLCKNTAKNYSKSKSKNKRYGICAIFGFCVLLLSVCMYANYVMPDHVSVIEGETLIFQNGWITVKNKENEQQANLFLNDENEMSYTAQLSVFNVLPIKKVKVDVIHRENVVLAGTPFGVKMLANGAIVIGIAGIQTENGLMYPAAEAGIQIGDVITQVNQIKIRSNEDVSEILEESHGNTVKLSILRAGNHLEAALTPVKSLLDNRYKGGMWVRDSTAGIGTITFYDPKSHGFGGLGHGICDMDTRELIPLQSGDIVDVTITGCVRGMKGRAGELQGYFSGDQTIGVLSANIESGVYGILDRAPDSSGKIEIALKQEVQKGDACILATIHDQGARMYAVKIEDVNYNERQRTKNLVIRVTDPELIEATGGIVQGMSGSPIIQNGRLIGAVTHVFLNDPTRGYGIFAENMMADMKTSNASSQNSKKSKNVA